MIHECWCCGIQSKESMFGFCCLGFLAFNSRLHIHNITNSTNIVRAIHSSQQFRTTGKYIRDKMYSDKFLMVSTILKWSYGVSIETIPNIHIRDTSNEKQYKMCTRMKWDEWLSLYKKFSGYKLQLSLRLCLRIHDYFGLTYQPIYFLLTYKLISSYRKTT